MDEHKLVNEFVDFHLDFYVFVLYIDIDFNFIVYVVFDIFVEFDYNMSIMRIE